MKSKFYDYLEELMSTTSAGIGSNKTEPSVNPTNDDFYARGDARIPMGPKKKKCKRGKKCECRCNKKCDC